ncbi:MAG TPA: ZIP family metal transporter [Gemmatimonadaceae bacterium]|nr:ZIP family metal transporter [Gemmatimonadaceae bacterium]
MSTVEAAYGLSAALANVVGAVAITSGRRWSVRALDRMLSFAAGFLLSVAFVDLFPQALARNGSAAAVAALIAYLLVHLTQHTFGRHFHFGEETHSVSRAVSTSALLGLLLHTFVDGVAVASGLLVNGTVGTLVFVGVLLHKFPEGLAISSMFLAAGANRTQAIAAAAALGIATIMGVMLTDHFVALQGYGLAISAGVTIYVGASNLVPELQARGGWETPFTLLAGSAAYFATRALL